MKTLRLLPLMLLAALPARAEGEPTPLAAAFDQFITQSSQPCASRPAAECVSLGWKFLDRDRNGGLSGFSKAVERLADLSKAAAAEGLINTHTFVDGSAEHLREVARARAEGKRNPFLIGTDLVVKHYQVFGECLKAAMERPQDASGEWSRALPKDPQP